MSTTRDYRNRYNRRRARNLIQARQERKLHRRRVVAPNERVIFDSLEHDRRVEEELIYGTPTEQEMADDPTNKW